MKNLKIVKSDDKNPLKLTNNGELAIFFIGTGSAFSKTLYQNNIIIIKGDAHILVDCGTRTPQALSKYGCPITNIRNFLITHSHADHVGGLEEAALMSRYVIKQRPKMIITKEYEKILWEHSLKGGCGFNEIHDGKFLEFEDLFEPIRPKKLKNEKREIFNIDFQGINIKLFRTKHIPDNAETWKESVISYGILIDEKILFSADTRFDKVLFDDLFEKYKIDYIFHDCQFFPGGVHASYDELKTLDTAIKNKMFLTHYGDNYSNFTPSNDGFIDFTQSQTFYIFN